MLLHFGYKIDAEGNCPHFDRNIEKRERAERAERFKKISASTSVCGVSETEVEREYYVEDIFKNIPKKRYVVYGVLIGIATISFGMFLKKCSKEDKK